MTDSKSKALEPQDQKRKTLSLPKNKVDPKKRHDTLSVRQSFSRGLSKSVPVEQRGGRSITTIKPQERHVTLRYQNRTAPQTTETTGGTGIDLTSQELERRIKVARTAALEEKLHQKIQKEQEEKESKERTPDTIPEQHSSPSLSQQSEPSNQQSQQEILRQREIEELERIEQEERRRVPSLSL